MPPKAGNIRAVLLAAGLSAPQLRRVSDHAFQTELPVLSTTDDTGILIDALVDHAETYDLLRELAAVVSSATASTPAVQNLIFGGGVMDERNDIGGLGSERMYARLDKLFDLIADIDKRLARLEATQQHSAPVPINWNIIGISLILSIMLALAAYTLPRVSW